MKHGKKYKASIAKYDGTATYPLEKAVDLVKELAYAKFDETVEVSMKLDIKSKHTIRDVMALPHLFGKEKKILVFAKESIEHCLRREGRRHRQVAPRQPFRQRYEIRLHPLVLARE